MKRTKEKTEIEIEDEERQQMFRNQITNAMRHQGSVTFKMNLYIPIVSVAYTLVIPESY